MLRKFLLVALVFISGWTSAYADEKPLTVDQVKRFAASLPALNALGAEFEEEGKIENLRIANKPVEGEVFQPYTNAVAMLSEKYPADLKRLEAAVKPHGFKTKEWGHIGDRVMVAYLALKMEEEDPDSMAMMEGFDKSMLDMVPPEMHAQLQQTFLMLETVKNAPEADKKIVAEVKPELDKVIDTDKPS